MNQQVQSAADCLDRNVNIMMGDCIDSMKSHIDSKSVQTCITSPPYFGLRDYGVDGQIGLEKTPDIYVRKIVEVFREVRRVLRDDGTVWLNIGDSYAGSGKGRGADGLHQKGGKQGTNMGACAGILRRNQSSLPAKNLIGIPWRVAFALQEDGWYLRQDIIWRKPNPMPESVADRCTKSHEYIFLLSKSPKYYFDNESIKEPVSPGTLSRLSQNIDSQAGSNRIPGKINGSMKAVGSIHKRNKRSVWTVSTKPYKRAHFATFPIDLIEPCVLAGSKKNDIVLDPFAGSGTVGQAALKHGRKSILCELNIDYKSLIVERVSKVANK